MLLKLLLWHNFLEDPCCRICCRRRKLGTYSLFLLFAYYFYKSSSYSTSNKNLLSLHATNLFTEKGCWLPGADVIGIAQDGEGILEVAPWSGRGGALGRGGRARGEDRGESRHQQCAPTVRWCEGSCRQKCLFFGQPAHQVEDGMET